MSKPFTCSPPHTHQSYLESGSHAIDCNEKKYLIARKFAPGRPTYKSTPPSTSPTTMDTHTKKTLPLGFHGFFGYTYHMDINH